MNHLTDRFFFLIGLLLFMGLAALVVPALTILPLVAWPLLILATFLDRRTLVPAGVLEGTAEIPKVPEIGDPVKIDIALALNATGKKNLSPLTLLVPQLETIVFPIKSRPFSSETRDGKRILCANLEGTARRLGFEKLERIDVIAHSLGRLWVRRMAIPITTSGFRVIPSRKTPREQVFRELAQSQRLLFQGNRRRIRSHTADQFYSIREYQYPDPVRFIDAKKTARYQKLMTRTFDSFFDHHLILGLDVGRSLAGVIQESEKHDFYLAACLALAENAHRSRDRISFFAFSQRIHYSIRAARNLGSFRPLFEGRAFLKPREEESNYELILPTVQRLSGQRSIVVLFTDALKPSVQEALRGPLAEICGRHLTVVVSLVDEDYSLEPLVEKLNASELTPEAYNRLLYAGWLKERALSFQSQVASKGGGVIVVSHKQWLSVVVHLYDLLRSSISI